MNDPDDHSPGSRDPAADEPAAPPGRVTVHEDVAALLREHLEQARWFGGKGREFRVAAMHRLGTLAGPYDDTEPHVSIQLAEVRYAETPGHPEESEFYQLPLAFYTHHQGRLDHALIGVWEDAEHGWAHVYDAVHDREAMARWLYAFDAAAVSDDDPEATGDKDEGGLHFRRLPGHELDLSTHSTLFSGEQSNSSLAFGDDALMKLFRKVTPGVNPDVEIHEVLTRAGSDHVAALYGWLEAPDPASGAVMHLAMLQQFLRTASDGWDLALASIRNLFAEGDLHADEVGGDFAAEAARLGVALAEVHQTLAEHFPTYVRTGEQMAELADAMHTRLEAAVRVAPQLADYVDGLTAAYERVGGLAGVEVQRVHGDLHLGQTLRTVKGWKIVDFEGEPAKPLADRVLPDSRWRDVAGMLRSFDYAPRVVERQFGDADAVGSSQRAYRASEWAERNCEAFLSAYADRALTDEEQALLAAYVADKAVYETVYEARNRPSWVPIPLAAVAKIGA